MSNIASILNKLNRSQRQSVLQILTKLSNLETIEPKDVGWLGYTSERLPKEDILQIFKGDRKRFKLAMRILSSESPIGIGYYNLSKVINAVINEEVAAKVTEELEPEQMLMVDPDKD